MTESKRFSKTQALAALLAVGLGLTATSTVFAAEQKVFIDPETGDIVQQPVPDDSDQGVASGDAASRAGVSAPKTWKNSEGAQMLTPNFESAPTARAVRCPDGSLHMGHAAHDQSGDDAAEALCAAHDR